MATPRKKTKPAARPSARKSAGKRTPGRTTVRPAATKPTPKATSRRPALKPTALPTAPDGRGPAKTTAPRTAPAPARERLSTIKPSGGKDDSFFDLVHQVARQIPKGRVTSYGAIAAALGTRMSARMVGWAMMAVPFAEESVPAHRVVNRVGLLTGKHHYDPPGKMQLLLEKEGVKVKDDKVVDFQRLFWDPAKEL
jgi:methylated-DNA-protein-cysteine methyltransferase-like protein